MSTLNTIFCLWLRQAEASALLPQNPPQQCQVVLLGQLKNKKMPFVAGKVGGAFGGILSEPGAPG